MSIIFMTVGCDSMHARGKAMGRVDISCYKALGQLTESASVIIKQKDVHASL